MSDPLTDSKPRYELKMVCEGRWLANARTWIKLHPAAFREAYPPRIVNNLYLDTPHLSSFRTNLAGVSSRQKLRLRWYGLTDGQMTKEPVLELKTKENLLGNKKQQPLSCLIDWQRPYPDILQAIRSCAPAEWQQWLQAACQPTLINSYRREYYVSMDGDLRATLDYAQSGFDQRLGRRPNFTRRLPLADLVVIEMKAAPDCLDPLQAAMAFFPIPRSRNSKYINGVEAILL